MKKSVITYVMGDGDDLLEPYYTNEDWDLVCFTNREDIKSKVWNVVFVKDEENSMNDKRFANYFKFNPFSSLHSAFDINYDICVIMDANVRITNDLDKIVSFYCPTLYDMTLAKHPIRDCSYDECNAVLGEKKDNQESIGQNMNLFKKENYPKNNGLYQTTIMIWKNTQGTKKISSEFWSIYNDMSERDQLLVPYILWKHPEINLIETKWADFKESFGYEQHSDSKKKDE